MASVTPRDIENWFSYHSPTQEQVGRFEKLREAAKQFAYVIVECTPECADQAAALRQLRETVMSANAAIACNELRRNY